MKTMRTVFAFLLVLVGGLATGSAFAAGPHGGGGHGGGHSGGHWHSSVGFYFGVPAFGFGYPYYYPPYAYAPSYYYPPYYSSYYPQVQQAPVYVEQNPQPAPSAQPSAPAGYWYYCADSRAFYPYVRECLSGWQRVAPQPG